MGFTSFFSILLNIIRRGDHSFISDLSTFLDVPSTAFVSLAEIPLSVADMSSVQSDASESAVQEAAEPSAEIALPAPVGFGPLLNLFNLK